MSCLIVTPEIKDLASKLQGETEQSILGLVGLWQEFNNKSIEEYPSVEKLDEFRKEIRKESPLSVVKPKLKGKMNFSFGTEKRKGISSLTTIEAIKRGERTATTRYSSDGNIQYWQRAKIGDIIEFSGNGETVLVKVTKPLTQLDSSITGEEWSLKEGWSIDRFNRKVKPAIDRGEAYQMEFVLYSPTYETAKISTNAESASFNTSKVSSIKEQAKVNLDFDPRTRRDRVSLIARFFSNEIDRALQEFSEALNKRIGESDSPENVSQLKVELNELTRRDVINKLTPSGIFQRVANIFRYYVEANEQDRINAELRVVNSARNASEFTEEERLNKATDRARYKYNEYKKILDNFQVLSSESSPILSLIEGVVIDPNGYIVGDTIFANDEMTGETQSESFSGNMAQEESHKDGWMTNYRFVSAHESISQEVRKIINRIPRLNYAGKFDKDDLGFNRYLDASYVHATLIDGLRDMITPNDMIPTLRRLSETKPWVKLVIKAIEKDSTTFSKFYQDFRKDFTNYWIQRRKMNSDGSSYVQTIAINRPEGVQYLLNSWRDNYDSGNILTEDSVYGKGGQINIENAKKGLNKTLSLTNKLNGLTTDDRLKLISEDDSILNDISNLLKMIGVDPNPSILKATLLNKKEITGIEVVDPIMVLLPQLNIIFRGISRGELSSSNSNRKDLINAFGGVYDSIASMFSEVTDDAIESSFRENDKTYYSHTTPSYIGKIVKQLKNVSGDKARFDSFMLSEYKQYDWFFKDGKWRNDWLRQLESSQEIRDGFDHKVVLNRDKVNYTDWDPLDYTLVLLGEYWSNPVKKGSSIQWAWYHVPILSDSPSAEFLRFRKYTDGNIINEETGEYRTYKDIILEKLTDLVSQEYNRIMLVRKRDIGFQSGDPNISPIANYDIVRAKDGSIKSIGGAEFKFIPALNSIEYEGGRSFIDILSSLTRGRDGATIKRFISDTLTQIMEDGFEAEYREWNRIGLFEELPNGKYKNLPFDGHSKSIEQAAKSLAYVKSLASDYWTEDMEELLRNYINNNPVDDRAALSTISEVMSIVDNMTSNETLSPKRASSIKSSLIVKNPTKKALREYYWNSKLATSQIIQITTTDLAFYKNMEDFQKRFKEIHAPSLRLNTEAIFNGERVGREWERTIYLADDIITSPSIEDISEILDKRVESRKMSKKDRDSIIDKFKEVNVADAQAYRSLSSYRAILVMSGDWNDRMEKAFNNLKSGNWDASDFDIIWQTKKPYLYTQVGNISGVEGFSNIKTPVQHKNSEFLLLAAHSIVSNVLGKSEKLRAINDFMEENNIDVVQFESTTKVGKQGIIDLNNVNDYEGTKKLLKDATIQDGIENPNVVHKVRYEDYGIQTATPEHLIDITQLIGTQIRKLITADISPEAIIDVAGKKLSKQEWLDLYNSINVENILDSYIGVRNVFDNVEDLGRILLEEIRGNQKYGSDMARACSLNENKEFTIPLFEPIQSSSIQSLLLSIIKNRITKQKIRGGSLIQVSDYGLTDDLHIVFEGEGENKRIKYLECYMPAYSRDFYEPLMKEGTHELDITKLPNNLRKLIGYRVPTEDKYSMAPLYIKGFLPQQNGSAIMLPAEITTLAGSDFDIDKLYVMLPEFRMQKYDYKRAKQDFKGEQEVLDKLSSLFKEDSILDDLTSAPIEFREWFKENKEKYRLAKSRPAKINYNFDKAPWENSLEARNNLLIDMMWGVLTNSDTAPKVLNPGGFDNQKISARLVDILKSSTKEELSEALKVKEEQVVPKLLSMNLDELSKLNSRTKKIIDPLAPTTQVMFHQQNMTGAKLIGIYANHNANHALMQHTNLEVSPRNGGIRLNDKMYTSLHNITNEDQEYISRNNAGFLAASVDNVKDPVLASLNQNELTADATMLLSRLGYNPVEIGLLMNQPVVLDITQKYFRERRSGKSKKDIIDEVLSSYREKAGVTSKLVEDRYLGDKFLIKDLAENIISGSEIRSYNSQIGDKEWIEFHKQQAVVGHLFKRLLNTSNALGELVLVSRSDTQNGGAGASIANLVSNIQRVEDFAENYIGNSTYPLSNVPVLMTDRTKGVDNKDGIREDILKGSSTPILQAFYSLGVEGATTMMNKYFPQLNPSFGEVIDSIRGLTRSGKLDVRTMNSVYNDLIAYILSNTEFFGAERDQGRVLTSYVKREAFIYHFPTKFSEIVRDNKDIADLDFIKRLTVVKANDRTPVDTIVFKNVGHLTPTLKERYMRDWASLLYMENPEAHKLALNLVRYSYYKNGFAFGPSSFIHLAPIEVKEAIPGYIDTLRSILKFEDDHSDFVEQYIYNHLDNRRIVPRIPDSKSTSFVNDNNKILDEVEIEITIDSDPDIKKIVKEIIRNSDGDKYVFFKFISKEVNGKNVYYRLRESIANIAIYERIYPLGQRNFIIEYEYGRSVEDMTSILGGQRNEAEPNTVNMEEIRQEDMQVDKGVNSSELELINQAFETINNTSLEQTVGENDLLSVEPNTNYLDADNNPICGASTLF